MSLGVYVHVPFCATRCGYCDFNTYTLAEVGGEATVTGFVEAALAELASARRQLTDAGEVDTVFFGGGTPTMLDPADLARILHAIDDAFGLAAGAEVTTEANPESVDLQRLSRLREAGFTRISFGVQSTSARVLASLDRTHTPGRGIAAIAEAVAAGFDHVSADLIYGADGETDDDWTQSVEAVASSGVDHVSAYSLIVEDGTRLGARVQRGEVSPPVEDDLARRYVIADELLQTKGFAGYEVSNWAKSVDARCRHNLGYWTGGDWWGIGPGAHSHVDGVRWWNLKNPRTYAARLAAGESPMAGREVLTATERHTEEIMLRVRLSDGLDSKLLSAAAAVKAKQAAVDGLIEPDRLDAGMVVLTARGRLLADAVIRDLVDI